MIETEDFVPCRDPECEGWADTEVDGDVRFRICGVCGFEFAYERVGVEAGDACAIGVPEQLRRAASGPMEAALAEQRQIPLIVRRSE